jgi:iron-sulfur cluster repair protein YtfE (RIC family)
MAVVDKIVDAVTPPESEEKRTEARSKARSVAEPGDWLSQILDHHEQLDAAFAEARNAAGSVAAEAALKRLGELLTGHSIAEEAVVYPALAQIGKSGHADMAYTEQVAAKMQMAALEKLDPMSEDFEDKLGHLQGAVQHHMYKEESDWFVDLKQQAPAADQIILEARYIEEFSRYMSGGERMSARPVASEARSFADQQ